MRYKNFVLGFLLTATITTMSIIIGNVAIVKSIGISAITIAIIIGIIIDNSFYQKIANQCDQGVSFAKRRLLRLGIIFYGFHLTFQEIASVGMNAIIADAIIVSTTFFFTLLLSKYIFKLDGKTAILIGAGSSICGAAAILATEPVVKADSNKVAIAVATVVIYGSIAMFLYPIIYQLNILPFNAETFGIYIGSSVHEVAQVYAAGASINSTTADIAVTTKMIRVMMLAPFLIILSLYLSQQEKQHKMNWQRISIPWFALLFILVAGFNSLSLFSDEIVNLLRFIDQVMLTMAMAALGLTTHFSAIKKAGLKPILLGLIVFIWLIVVAAILQILLP